MTFDFYLLEKYRTLKVPEESLILFEGYYKTLNCELNATNKFNHMLIQMFLYPKSGKIYIFIKENIRNSSDDLIYKRENKS